jgi:hypothetical protein
MKLYQYNAQFSNEYEVVQDFSYNASKPPVLEDSETISIQMNQSMILLPEKLMQPRLADSRVGWFTMSQFDWK